MGAISPPGSYHRFKAGIRICVGLFYVVWAFAIATSSNYSTMSTTNVTFTLTHCGTNAMTTSASMPTANPLWLWSTWNAHFIGMAQSTMLGAGVQLLEQAIDMGLKRVQLATITTGWVQGDRYLSKKR